MWNRSFGIAAILVAGLVLAVLFVPGGAFAQDGSTSSGATGRSGVAAIGSMIMQGWNHDQMHANAAQYGAGQMGQSMMGTGQMGNHANMTGAMTGSMATMHAGMMGRGMGNMMVTGAEHHQHMSGTMPGTDECPLAGADVAEHAAACTYLSPTTGGE